MASISIRCPTCSATEGVVRNGTRRHILFCPTAHLKQPC
ncbi:IS1 family transposase [Klebsiella pneumoniae]|nr:hypothetical protein [Enterobacter kobei]